MDTHEISRDKPKPSGEAATPPTAASATEATPRMALASVPPAIEAPAAEAPTIALASVEAPKITPDLDELKPPPGKAPPQVAADEAVADEAAAAEPAGENAAPRISRFTLLAATLALAAAVGGMVGALVAYGLARPGPPPVTAGRTDLDEVQALKENVVQARVDLAALKVSVESATRSANAQFTRIGERIERVERLQGEPATKLNKAIETLERLSRDAAAGQSKEVTGSVAPQAGAPAKSGGVEGWVVRDVHRGTALIEGRMGLIEVDQGDFVPGLGRVDAIRKQDGRWVVVTSKGIIMPPR
jgi:hypothetical protein